MSYTLLSTYSGAGGMDIGFTEAGFKGIWANDFNLDATLTHKTYFGDSFPCTCGDITTFMNDLPSADVVIGGPPCQGFSIAGKMDPSDPRSQQVFNFLEVVRRVNPVAFVMENVSALATNPRWAGTREDILKMAHDLGYTTHLYLLDASHFGVPQTRRRMFLVGLKPHLTHIAPAPTTAQNPLTVRQTLATLPPYLSPGNDTLSPSRIVIAKNPILRSSPYLGSLLFNGNGRVLDLDKPARTITASSGNHVAIIDQSQLDLNTPPYVERLFTALASGNPRPPVPPYLRRLTLQEAAALQGFPVGMQFVGTVSSQYKQAGNAVPPPLAKAVALALKHSLDNA